MMTFLQCLERFSHPCVRDLAWAIGAPPSMHLENDPRWIEDDQFTQWLLDGLSWFDALDQDPTALLQVLHRPGQHRLGLYFERLIGFWIEHGSPYRLLAKNLQIHDEGRTVGEFDFLVDGDNGPEHWEVAVKFYLGVGTGLHWHHWLGPNQRDRLSKKLNHMLDHQANLSRTYAGAAALRTLQLERQPTVRLWFKGHFFRASTVAQSLPHDSTSVCWDRWLEPAELKEYTQSAGGDTRWVIRQKPDWLCPLVHVDETALSAEMLMTIAQNLERPLMLSECVPTQRALTQEVRRLFVMPTGWTERAKQKLNEC